MQRTLESMRHFRHQELGLLRCESWMQNVVLARILAKNSNCIDVGAHIGSFTRSLYQHAPEGNHTIVEAVPYKAEWLRKRFPAATHHQCAVSDQDGEISFFENLENAGFSSLTHRASRGRHNECKVKCSRLDTLMENTNVNFLKIDVEGHEWAVVKGAKRLIETSRPMVMFEAGAAHDADIDDAEYIEMFNYWTEQVSYDVYGIFDYYYSRPPLTATAFQSYRTYPFLSFNFLAMPRTCPDRAPPC
jgi:FkbM family methyltransferase